MERERLGRTTCLAALVVAMVTTGCFSFSTMHSATPVGEGNGEVSMGVGYVGFSGQTANVSQNDQNQDTTTNERQAVNLPTSELHARFGIIDSLDVGLKIFPIGAGLDVNYAPVNTDSFAFALNPSISGMVLGPISWGNASMNLLADVVKADPLTLTVGAKPGYLFATAGTAVGGSPFVGGNVLIDLQFIDILSLFLEGDVVYFVQNNTTQTLIFQPMLGISLNF